MDPIQFCQAAVGQLKEKSRVIGALLDALPDHSVKLYGGFLRRAVEASFEMDPQTWFEEHCKDFDVDINLGPITKEEFRAIIRAFQTIPMDEKKPLQVQNVHLEVQMRDKNTIAVVGAGRGSPVLRAQGQVVQTIRDVSNYERMKVIRLTEKDGMRFDIHFMCPFTHIDFLCNTLTMDLRTLVMSSFQDELRDQIPSSHSLEHIFEMIKMRILVLADGYCQHAKLLERAKKMHSLGYYDSADPQESLALRANYNQSTMLNYLNQRRAR